MGILEKIKSKLWEVRIVMIPSEINRKNIPSGVLLGTLSKYPELYKKMRSPSYEAALLISRIKPEYMASLDKLSPKVKSRLINENAEVLKYVRSFNVKEFLPVLQKHPYVIEHLHLDDIQKETLYKADHSLFEYIEFPCERLQVMAVRDDFMNLWNIASPSDKVYVECLRSLTSKEYPLTENLKKELDNLIGNCWSVENGYSRSSLTTVESSSRLEGFKEFAPEYRDELYYRSYKYFTESFSYKTGVEISADSSFASTTNCCEKNLRSLAVADAISNNGLKPNIPSLKGLEGYTEDKIREQGTLMRYRASCLARLHPGTDRGNVLKEIRMINMELRKHGLSHNSLSDPQLINLLNGSCVRLSSGISLSRVKCASGNFSYKIDVPSNEKSVVKSNESEL